MAAFQINEQGARAAVVAHLLAREAVPAEDQTQIKGAVGLAVSEIGALPAEFTGAHAILSGTDSGGVRTISVQVAGIKLRL